MGGLGARDREVCTSSTCARLGGNGIAARELAFPDVVLKLPVPRAASVSSLRSELRLVRAVHRELWQGDHNRVA